MRGRAVLGVIGLVAVAIGIVARRARDEEIAAAGVEVDSELLRRCADEDGALPHVAGVVLERDGACPRRAAQDVYRMQESGYFQYCARRQPFRG